MQVLVLCGIQRRKDARQQQVRRRQVDTGISGSVFSQAHGAAVQAQALAHVQRHVAVKTQQAVAEQSQVVKTTSADLIHPKAAMTVFQARSRGIGGTR